MYYKDSMYKEGLSRLILLPYIYEALTSTILNQYGLPLYDLPLSEPSLPPPGI